MAAVAAIPDVAAAALPSSNSPCALACANLLLAAAGVRMDAPCGVSVGCLTAAGDRRRREDSIPHFAFRRHSGLPHHRQRTSCRLPTDPMTHITPAKFLSSPDLWIGLAIAAAFLAAAVRLRRYQ